MSVFQCKSMGNKSFQTQIMLGHKCSTIVWPLQTFASSAGALPGGLVWIGVGVI